MYSARIELLSLSMCALVGGTNNEEVADEHYVEHKWKRAADTAKMIGKGLMIQDLDTKSSPAKGDVETGRMRRRESGKKQTHELASSELQHPSQSQERAKVLPPSSNNGAVEDLSGLTLPRMQQRQERPAADYRLGGEMGALAEDLAIGIAKRRGIVALERLDALQARRGVDTATREAVLRSGSVNRESDLQKLGRGLKNLVLPIARLTEGVTLEGLPMHARRAMDEYEESQKDWKEKLPYQAALHVIYGRDLDPRPSFAGVQLRAVARHIGSEVAQFCSGAKLAIQSAYALFRNKEME